MKYKRDTELNDAALLQNEQARLPPFFVDWLDLRLTRNQVDQSAVAQAARLRLETRELIEGTRLLRCSAGPERYWHEPEGTGWLDFPVVGRVAWMGRDGGNRRREYRATGTSRQAFFWSPGNPSAFASLPGQWFLDSGWQMIRSYDDLAGHEVSVQRIDFAFHLPRVTNLYLTASNQATVQPFLQNGIATGWVVGGSNGWMLRVYRKDIHDPDDHCETRFPGLKDALPWRVELQLRAEWLKGRATSLRHLADPGRAWSLVKWALEAWGVVLVGAGDGTEVIELPGVPGDWKATRLPFGTQRASLYAQARGCYLTALLAGFGIRYLPTGDVRRAWAEEIAPGLQSGFAAIETEIETLVRAEAERVNR